MGEKISLKLDVREVHGKKVRKLREQGLVPGVVYGHGLEPVAVQAEAGEVRRVVNAAGKHTPVNLTGAKKRIAMIKDITYDATKHGVIHHVSFHAVKADEPVHAEVPVRLVGVGESAAEKAGLVVLQAIDKIEVRALPMELPEAIEIDITSLSEAGEKVTLGDAKLANGVDFVEHDSGHHEDDEEEKPSVADLVVASVYEPAALEAANEAAAGTVEDESEVVTAGEELEAETTEQKSTE
ncbi:MAG: 50S ribosomal protein L25 [Candidatus Saccharimonas sp.]